MRPSHRKESKPKKEPNMKAENPETISVEARELQLWVDNNKDAYRHLLCAHQNLLRKVSKGIYDSTKAARLMEYVAETAAKTYVKAFGGGPWHSLFTPAIRKECARLLVRDFEREHDIA